MNHRRKAMLIIAYRGVPRRTRCRCAFCCLRRAVRLKGTLTHGLPHPPAVVARHRHRPRPRRLTVRFLR